MGLTLTFGGVSSTECGLEIERPPAYFSAERDVSAHHVNGRNGDILVSTGAFKNVTVKYDINFGRSFLEGFTKNARSDPNGNGTQNLIIQQDPQGFNMYDVNSELNGDGTQTLRITTKKQSGMYYQMAERVYQWLTTPVGYARLEDSSDPDYYRLGYFKQNLEFENILSQAGRGTIEFICKPEKYRKFRTEHSTSLTNVVNAPRIFIPFTDDGYKEGDYISPVVDLTLSSTGESSVDPVFNINGTRFIFSGPTICEQRATRFLIDYMNKTITYLSLGSYKDASAYVKIDGDFRPIVCHSSGIDCISVQGESPYSFDLSITFPVSYTY